MIEIISILLKLISREPQLRKYKWWKTISHLFIVHNLLALFLGNSLVLIQQKLLLIYSHQVLLCLRVHKEKASKTKWNFQRISYRLRIKSPPNFLPSISTNHFFSLHLHSFHPEVARKFTGIILHLWNTIMHTEKYVHWYQEVKF